MAISRCTIRVFPTPLVPVRMTPRCTSRAISSKYVYRVVSCGQDDLRVRRWGRAQATRREGALGDGSFAHDSGDENVVVWLACEISVGRDDVAPLREAPFLQGGARKEKAV